jgi:RNA polymerase sigma factor (sigma-70 family)
MRTVTSQLIHYLSTVTDHRTDGELLGGFLSHNAEADFAELVRRHGPMVWGACRRALPDYSDAEDAFQAVFLVLVQRGNRLVGLSCLGPWLHRVAIWTTRNVRRRNARRLARRESLPEQFPVRTANVDLSLDLDTALMSLPEKFRSSIVLCHLLGFSRADAAAQLGCAERTLSSWLSRGLAQLRQKFRGLDPVKALSVAAVAVPAALAESAVHAAVSLQSAAIATAVLSPTISQLVEGVIRMFWVKKATAVSVAMFAMFAFGVGIGVSTHQLAPAAGGDEKVVVSQAAKDADQQADLDDAKIADLEPMIVDLTKARIAAEAKAETLATLVAELVKTGLDAKEIEKYRDDLTQAKQEAVKIARKLEQLKNEVRALHDLRAAKALERAAALQDKQQPKATQSNKFQPPVQQDLDKQLVGLEEKLKKLNIDAKTLQALNEAKLQELKAQIEVVTTAINAVKKEKEKAKEKAPENKLNSEKAKGGYLELTLDAKFAPGAQLGGLNAPSFPFQVKEVGVDGKIVGSVYFTNADILGRYLARTMKDVNGPKELRIITRADTPANLIQTAVEAVGAAGFKDVLVSKEKTTDAAATAAEAMAKYIQQLEEADRKAKEYFDPNKLQAEKQNKEALLKSLEQLLKAKEEEIRKLKEQNKQQKPDGKLGNDQQDKVLQELEAILKMKEDELRKLEQKDKLDKKVKPPSPLKP